MCRDRSTSDVSLQKDGLERRTVSPLPNQLEIERTRVQGEMEGGGVKDLKRLGVLWRALKDWTY